MPNSKLDDLLFEQGGRCFFCQKPLARGEARVEHLVAKANGGAKNDLQNLVACCKSMNTMLGDKSLKEKLRILLNQPGKVQCPKPKSKPRPAAKSPDELQRVLANLQQRGPSCPKTLPKLKIVIASLCAGDTSEDKVTMLVERLASTGKIIVEGENITYAL